MKTLERENFERLFKEEFKGLVLFAIQYVKDYEAAREIVQEAFVNMWSRREQIDLSRPVKTYIVTSVKNRSLNYLRDNKKFDSNLLIHEDIYPTTSCQQSDHLVEAELRERITHAINELPEKCREVFLMNRNEHLKYREIADQLQISVKTVETQMSKALQHMRVRLKEYLVILLMLIWSQMLDARYLIPNTPCLTFHVSRLTSHEMNIRVNPLSCVLLPDK